MAFNSNNPAILGHALNHACYECGSNKLSTKLVKEAQRWIRAYYEDNSITLEIVSKYPYAGVIRMCGIHYHVENRMRSDGEWSSRFNF